MSIKALACAVLLLLASILPARAAEPIRIGFSCEETGGSAASGRQFLLTAQIWADRINKQGRAARPAGRADPLRRPEQPGARPRHLHKAARCRQGRSDHCLRHQLQRRRDAALHGAQADGARHAGAGGQRRIPLSALFPDDAVRAARQGGDHIRLFRRRDDDGPEAENDRDDRRRRRVLEKRDGRGARAREEGRAADRLRQELSPEYDRLHADRARDQGDQPGPRLCRLVPGRQRRHIARGRGAGADRENVRRPDHRAAIRLDQAADGRAVERHRRLRIVRARADDEFSRRR